MWLREQREKEVLAHRTNRAKEILAHKANREKEESWLGRHQTSDIKKSDIRHQTSGSTFAA